MIDPEDFKPLGRELRKIRDSVPIGHMDRGDMRRIANRMILSMSNWSDDRDDGKPRQLVRRGYIGKQIMRDLAWVTAWQWQH